MQNRFIRKASRLLVMLTAVAATASADDPTIVLGVSDWTGSAPLILAEKAGLFKQQGVSVKIKVLPQRDSEAELAAGAMQCVAATVESHLAWTAKDLPTVQIFQVDKSHGANGLVVREGIRSMKDLKGKTIGVDGPGTASYFGLAWMLKENGMSLRDVNTVPLTPEAAAQFFLAGQTDAAMTHEPYLSSVRGDAVTGNILASTIEYPIAMVTVGCSSSWLRNNPVAARGLTNAYFAALEMIKNEPIQSREIMGEAFRQTGSQFARSAAHLRWQDKAANQVFFAREITDFMKKAGPVLVDAGVIAQTPSNLSALFDSRFVQ